MSKLIDMIKEIVGRTVTIMDGVMDVSESWYNDHLSGQKPYTHLLGDVWQLKMDRSTGYQPVWIRNGIASNRLMRFMSHLKGFYLIKRDVTLMDGSKMEVMVRKRFLKLDDTPLLYVQFCDDGDTPEQQAAFALSVKMIEKGIRFGGEDYEYCMSSASQKRSLQGVFVKKSFSYTDEYLALFDRSVEGMEEYLGAIGQFRGAEAVVEAITYGAYSQSYKGRQESAAKFIARVGAAGTATELLGNSWKVLHMGDVLFHFTEEIENFYRRFVVTDPRGNKISLYSEADIQTIKSLWKPTKLDGQSMVRASRAVEELKGLGYKVELSDVTGALLQVRWAGVKGTLLVVADHILDMCLDADGNPVYRGYDMIIEHSSWKYAPSQFYTGELAPYLELVNISKPKYTSYMNYQAWAALDGNMDDMGNSLKVARKVVDKAIAKIRHILTDIDAAKVAFGVMDSAQSPLNEIGIDPYDMTMTSKLTKIIAACPEAIYDRWVRRKALDLLAKTEDDIKTGKVEVEGANRYIISDPVAMLRTDLSRLNPETGLLDIHIVSMDQVGLRGINHVYWAGKDQEALLFRSPCIHPGEPQSVLLTSNVVEYVQAAFGKLPVREIYSSIRDVIVINGFSNILEAMGGADTDGDTVLCVLDKDIVALKDKRRKALLVSADAGTIKTDIDMGAVRDDMVFSLKNNGIGLITDYATTWRDIQMTVSMDKKVDWKIARGLKDMKDAASANLLKEKAWVIEDESIVRISNMDVYSPRSVYLTCNAALKQLRVLQEMAINTAKSGIFVEFGSEDDENNNFNHLAIDIRADWHKPKAKASKKYKSSTMMAEISSYVTVQWKALEDWADDSSAPLMPGIKAGFPAKYVDVLESVDSMRKEYGKRVRVLVLKELSKEEFNKEFENITQDYNTRLNIMAMDHGIDMVAVAAYEATNADTNKGYNGATFVWNCFFDEFIDTLSYYQDGSTDRLHRIFLGAEFTYMEFKEASSISVSHGEAFLDGVKIGTSRLDDGIYRAVVVGGMPYIKVEDESSSMQELTAKISGMEFPIIGIQKNEDTASGTMLTREKLIEYIGSASNKNILVTKVITFAGETAPKIGVFVRSPEGGYLTAGVIPFDTKAVANSLNMKAFRVSIPERADAPSRLVVRVEELIRDYM